MTITSVSNNVIYGKFVRKRQRIDFVTEKSIFLFLSSSLGVPTTFPVPWNPSPTLSQTQYVAAHPMNRAKLSLRITSASLLYLSAFHLDSNAPTYRIGRALVGLGTSPTTFVCYHSEYINYEAQYLFGEQYFPLDSVNDPSPITTVMLEFYTELSGTLNFINELFYPPPN